MLTERAQSVVCLLAYVELPIMTAVKQPLCLSLSFVGFMTAISVQSSGGALDLKAWGAQSKASVDGEAKAGNTGLRDR